eukprot:11294922-Karenia_brevis.AAC.1
MHCVFGLGLDGKDQMTGWKGRRRHMSSFMSGHSPITTENWHCVSSTSLLIFSCSSDGANTSIS